MANQFKYQTILELQEWIDMYFNECKANRSKDEFKRMLLSMGNSEGADAGKLKIMEKIEKLEEGPGFTEDIHPTVSGLAIYLGLSRRTLINYEGREEFFPTIEGAKARVESYLDQRTYHPNNNGVQFNLKNNFKWKDKQEVEHTGDIGNNGGICRATEILAGFISSRQNDNDEGTGKK
jgi:hypothetical protein